MRVAIVSSGDGDSLVAATFSGAGSGRPPATSIRWVSASRTRNSCSAKSGSMPASMACWRRVVSTSRTRAGWITGVSEWPLTWATSSHTARRSGDDVDQGAIELVDAGSQGVQIGHGGTVSAAG